MRRTHDNLLDIILKPLYYITDDELKWLLGRNETKPYKGLYRNELKKRNKNKNVVIA